MSYAILRNNRMPNNWWEQLENQKEFLEWLFKELRYSSNDDWYKITRTQILDNGGGGLLGKYYKNSPVLLLKTLIPDKEWLEWKFCITPNGFWKKIDNQKRYINWLGNELGYDKPNDWYKLTFRIIVDNCGGGLLANYYNNSPVQLLRGVFKENKWFEWKFLQTPSKFWENIENQKNYMIWLENELEYKSLDAWYEITMEIITKNYGITLFNYYNSILKLLDAIFPQHKWLGWKLNQTPQRFWENIDNQKQYITWLGKELGYQSLDDWYKITITDFTENYGITLLYKYHNGSVSVLLKILFPEKEWIEWKFENRSVPHGFWNETENQKRYIMWLKNELKYKSNDEWYNITVRDIVTHYGGGLLASYYNNSPYQLIKTMFPDYDWKYSKFKIKQYSLGQIQWLEYNKVTINDLRHICNHPEGEFRIPNSRYFSDGYSDERMIIFEYHGDFWHGNPKKYNPDDINPMTKTTYGDLYLNTLLKQKFCESKGYTYIQIWETDWKKGIIALITLQRKYKKKQVSTNSLIIN